MSDDHDELNKLIHQEADYILEKKGLLTILKKYGDPHVTGSYALQLMSWRDLDIYLENDSISINDFFKLGEEIASCLEPVKMNFRNERISKTEGLPKGLYWGIYSGNERKGAWKIDVWAVDSKECKSLLQYCHDIDKKLSPRTRKIILEIKSQCWTDPAYRRSYNSSDIYNAVLNEHITTVADFRKYLERK